MINNKKREYKIPDQICCSCSKHLLYLHFVASSLSTQNVWTHALVLPNKTTLNPCLMTSVSLLCPLGEDKGEGNRYQHFHAKEWLPASGGEPIRPAALHVLLHPTGLQSPAAVPLIQPDHAASLVHHAQLHRPHAGENQQPCQKIHKDKTNHVTCRRSHHLLVVLVLVLKRLHRFTTTSSSMDLRHHTVSSQRRPPSQSDTTRQGTGASVSGLSVSKKD